MDELLLTECNIRIMCMLIDTVMFEATWGDPFCIIALKDS